MRRLKEQYCAEQGEEKFFLAAAGLSIALWENSFKVALVSPWEGWILLNGGVCHVVQKLCDLGFVAIMAIIKISLIGNILQHNWVLVTEIKSTPEADFHTPCLSVGGGEETFLLFQACAWKMILVPRGSALSIEKNKWKGGSQVHQESELCLLSKALI